MLFKKRGVKKTMKHPPKKKVGASRKLKKSSRIGVFRKALKLVLGIGVVGCGVYFWPQINLTERWAEAVRKPISEVQIDGDFLYLSKSVIQSKVNYLVEKNLLDVNLESIKKTLESDPWVDSVVVARKWPGILYVSVSEQQPIARWGQQAFLNMRGDIVKVDGNISLQSLPELNASDRYAQEVLQHYLGMGKLLSQAELTLESVSLDDTKAWILTIDNNVQIYLGRDLIWEKLQSLVSAKKNQLAASFNNVEYVDLRYHNGFSVGWHESAAPAVIARVK